MDSFCDFLKIVLNLLCDFKKMNLDECFIVEAYPHSCGFMREW